MADYSSELHPDEMCPNCVTPWKCNGPHYTPEQAAIWKAGREAGMREAIALYDGLTKGYYEHALSPYKHYRDAIISAIEGAK